MLLILVMCLTMVDIGVIIFLKIKEVGLMKYARIIA